MRVVRGMLCAVALSWGSLGLSIDWETEQPCKGLDPLSGGNLVFGQIYTALQASEPAVAWFDRKPRLLAKRSPTINAEMIPELTCSFEVPRGERFSDPVWLRRVRYQFHFENPQIVAGRGRSVVEQHGMRFTYRENYHAGEKRTPVGFEVCRRPSGCGFLNYPLESILTRIATVYVTSAGGKKETRIDQKKLQELKDPNKYPELRPRTVAFGEPQKCALKPGQSISDFLYSQVGSLESLTLPGREERREYVRPDGTIEVRIVRIPGETVDPLFRISKRIFEMPASIRGKVIYDGFTTCRVAFPPDEPFTAREIDRRYWIGGLLETKHIADGAFHSSIHYNALRLDMHMQCNQSTPDQPEIDCPVREVINYAMCDGEDICDDMGFDLKSIGLK